MPKFSSLTPTMLCAVSFAVAFLISWLMTPFSKKIAVKIGAIAKVKDRSMHKKPMPLAGGIAIVSGFTISTCLFIPSMMGYEPKTFLGIISGSLLISIVGLLDDIYDLNAKIKLFFQILAALVAVISGITINNLSWPWGMSGILQLEATKSIITVLWIVGVTNAVNFIDGLDGLATGIASIASICLMLISALYGEPIVTLYTAILAGACLGFLPHNFNPAKIFMGDTGSTFLGYTLAVISVKGMIKGYTAITLIIAAVVLGLPLFDTSFAIIRRLLSGKSIMEADRGHLHHRLVDKGYSHRRAVLILYGISSAFGICGILIALNDVKLAIFIICLMFLVWILDLWVSRRKRMLFQDKNEEMDASEELTEIKDSNEN